MNNAKLFFNITPEYSSADMKFHSEKITKKNIILIE